MCFKAFEEEYTRAQKEKRDISRIFPDYRNYETIADIRYDDELTDKYYLCHFGTAYAFEYALMFEILLRDKAMCKIKRRLSVEPLSVLSLGCGSMIDRWSMEYAIAVLGSQGVYDFELEGYHGVDLVDWPVKMADGDFTQGDINSCFGEGIEIRDNVIVFPMILNELSPECIDELVRRIEQTDFPASEYYICFSHQHSNKVKDNFNRVDHGLRISGRIINAIRQSAKRSARKQGCRRKLFCSSDIIGKEGKASFLRDRFGENITDELYNEFFRDDDGFYSVGYSFRSTGDNAPNRFMDYDSTFRIAISPTQTMAQYFHQLDDVADVMNRTNTLVFQIVKIRRP